MEEDITELAEIEVRSDREDPAYAVMRKAIDLRGTFKRKYRICLRGIAQRYAETAGSTG